MLIRLISSNILTNYFLYLGLLDIYLIESGSLHIARNSQRTITTASKLQSYFIHHTFTSLASDPIRAVCAAQFTLLYSDSVAG